MKILIATDGSPYCRSAIEQYLFAPLFPGTEIRIVSAYKKSSPLMLAGAMSVLKDGYEKEDGNAYSTAGEAADHAANIVRRKNTGYTIITSVLDGAAKDVILKEADAFGAEKIVIGASGQGFSERFRTGSVCRAVALNANCSVEIIRI
ncbi:MAG TPA: universal stress protein [Chitinophagaceae bacterium]|jgi:nucleotide-binding universal stress UspA family protein|nr:universal stress protein [Chitinophagaceae bacterium]